MNNISKKEISDYVVSRIDDFHNSRLSSIRKLKLNTLLKRKNPYLFKAKNIMSAQDLVKSVLDAYLSSQEETLFGAFLEGLAIFVGNKIHGGRKSSGQGIDFEFEKDNIWYLVSIKSGPNWGNSSQIKKMTDAFTTAKRILRQNNPKANIIAINGCCYGRNEREDKGDHFKYCGQSFWEFLTGQENFYLDIIEPIGHQAKQKNDQYHAEYYRIVNEFTEQFLKDFCSDGSIDWNTLVIFNSGKG